MLALNLNQVRLNAKAQNKHDAIERWRVVGGLGQY